MPASCHTYLTVRLQIVLLQQNYLDELDSISTHIADTNYAAQNFHNSEVSHGHADFSPDIQDTTTTAHQNTTEYNAYSDEIPELEDDWDNGQFGDAESTLITHLIPTLRVKESDGTIPNSCWI